MRKLYICNSYYTLMIAIYDQFFCNDQIDVVLSNNIKGLKGVYNKIKKMCIFQNIYFFDDQCIREEIYKKLKSSILRSIYFFINRNSWKYIDKRLNFSKKISIENYDKFIVFLPNLPVALILMGMKKRYVFHEEGKYTLSHFLKKDRSIIYKFYFILRLLEKLKVFWGIPEGCSKYVDYYLTEDKKMEGKFIFGRPVYVSNVRDWGKDDLNYKEYIKNIFNIDSRLFINGKKILILTIYLYKSGIITTQKAQYNIYKNLVNYYKKQDMTIFIKPHPLDEVNYNGINDCIILDKDFPSEIFEVFKIGFDIIITIGSSSINNLKCVNEIYFYNLDSIINNKIDLTKYELIKKI